MNDFLVFNDAEIGDAIAQASRTHYNPKCNASIGRIRDGELMGGVIYTQFTGESVVMHQAAFDDHALNRDLLFVAFDYPFRLLGVKRLFGFVPETNEEALSLNRHFGFRVVAKIEGMFKHGVACIVMRLDREDCRFLNIKPLRIKVDTEH